ncbi:MAG: hypothetical protein IJF54_03195 [Clostridia bacterium]|nr:hypothetical protein [Clostridia bacterium]
MRFKHKAIISVIVCMMLTLTSCSGIFADPKTLMKPPKAVGSLSGIEDALYSAVGTDIEFVYPSSGEFRASCISKDIDGDKTDEAIVFYNLTSNYSAVHINFLKKIDGQWRSIYDMPIPGIGVERVEFWDIAGDSAFEIFVGSNMYNAREKQLSVYSLDNNTVTLRTQEPYTAYSVCNLTGNEKPQLLLLSINTTTKNDFETDTAQTVQKSATAKLISLIEGGTVVMGTVDMDPNITEFASITQSKVSAHLNGAYIDAYKGSSVMVTELIYYNQNKLYSAFYNSVLGETDLTYREAPVSSRDIDLDGRIEIPQLYAVPGYELSDAQNKIYYTVWKRFDGTYNTVMTSVFNVSDGYLIKLPENWSSNVTITRVTDEKLRVFSQWDFDNQVAGEQLFSIQVFSSKSWEENAHEGFRELISKNGSVYAVKINENAVSEYKLSYDYIAENFKLL